MACNCKNGRTSLDFLTTVPGGTAANATYLCGLTHWTCGNRKLCVSEVYQPVSTLQAKVVGSPVDAGNGTYCCEVLLTGTVTYVPYQVGCQCQPCPRTENIYIMVSLPCSSSAVPTLTVGDVACAPTALEPCCNITNAVAITTTINVTAGA